MNEGRINLRIENRIALIEISNPARRNALTLAIRQQTMDALRDLESQDKADCVIITGEGDSAFCAGADVNELKTRTVAGEFTAAARFRRELPVLLERMRLPSLAAINGYCFGGGLELALACTLRIAADTATIGMTEINLGIIPGSGGTQRLARMIGIGRAMEMVTLGEAVTAARAEQIGLVNAVHPPEHLREAAFEIARKWQAKGPVSLAAARDAALRSLDMDLATGLEYENRLFALCIASGERDEGVSAFLEKRKPNFRK